MFVGIVFRTNLNLRVQRIISGPFQENTFFVRYDDSPDLIFIDPGDEPEMLIKTVQDLQLAPLAIINTHAHLDHIGAVATLKDYYSIPFYLHQKEAPNLEMYIDQCRLFGLKVNSSPTVDYWFHHESSITIGRFTVKLLYTPGHTEGGTCLILEEHVFVGDTLFHGSVGRTDLPGGDWQTLEKSLEKIIREIPFDFFLHSGHGPDTTLTVEINENPFLIPLGKRVNFDS